MADRSVKVAVGANVSGLQAGMRTAGKAVEDFSKRSGKWFDHNRQSLDLVANSWLKMGAVAVGAGAFGVKAAMDWETAWTGVLKTVDGTSAQLEALEGDQRDLAKETGFAHAEVAAVAEAAGQLGISTPGVSRFTETMLAMGVSTNMSAEEAATGLARFRNIMGSTEADIEHMGSTIVGLGNNFATTEREILEMSLRIAGAGRQAGLSESDVMGLATAMSSVGIEAEAGGTAMSLTMKRIGREVDSNGSKLATFAQVAGMTAEGFSKAWKDDAGGALVQFVAGLDRASESGESVNQILSALGVTGIRESDALLRLSGNAEGLADALSMAGEEWSQNTALMEEAQKFYDTTAQRGRQAWASIKDSAIDAGDALLPIVAEIFDLVGGLADAFGSLPEPVKAGVTAMSGIAGMGLLAAAGLTKAFYAVQDLRFAIDSLNVSGGKVGGMLAGVGKAAGLLAIAAGIHAVGESVTKRNAKEMESFTEDIRRLGETGEWGGELERTFGKAGKGVEQFGRDMKSFGESFEDFDKFGDDQWHTRFGRHMLSTFGTGGLLHRGMRDQVNTIADMDAALASLTRNDPEVAVKAFGELRDRALETGGSVEELERAFPSMTEVMRSASAAMGGTSDASEILSGDLSDLAPSAQYAAEEMAEIIEAAEQQALAFLNLGDAVSSAEGDLGAFIKNMEAQAKALRDFADNAAEAADRGLDEGLIQAFRELGPAGAQMLAELAGASEREIGRANEAWASQRAAVNDYVDAVGEVPESVTTDIYAKDHTAGVISTLKTRLADITRGFTIPVVAHPIAAGPRSANGNLFQYADGGIDERGNRVPRIPQIRTGSQGTVMWGEPETGWEAYISGKPGKEARNREIWLQAGQRLGMVNRFAAGAGISASRTSVPMMTSPSRPASVGNVSLNADIYLQGDLLAKVHDVAVQVSEQTVARQQRFDSSQARALR